MRSERNSATAPPVARRPTLGCASPAGRSTIWARRQRLPAAPLRERPFRPQDQCQQTATPGVHCLRAGVDRAIPSESNRRRDGLYHAYNLVRFDSKSPAADPPPLRDARRPGRRAQFRPALRRGVARPAGRAEAQRDVPSPTSIATCSIPTASSRASSRRTISRVRNPPLSPAAQAAGGWQPPAHRARRRRADSLQRHYHQRPRHPTHPGPARRLRLRDPGEAGRACSARPFRADL